jgi:bacterioferritin (cytochrome b1)
MKLSQNTIDTEVAKYVKENKMYEEALNEYQEIYENIGRKESIIAELVIIDGFADTMDELNSANLENHMSEKVKIQMDLRNEYEKLRNLKYDITTMENIKDPEKGNIVGSRLVQKDINIRDTFIFSAKPEVIKYFFVPV